MRNDLRLQHLGAVDMTHRFGQGRVFLLGLHQITMHLRKHYLVKSPMYFASERSFLSEVDDTEDGSSLKRQVASYTTSTALRVQPDRCARAWCLKRPVSECNSSCSGWDQGISS